MARKAEWGGISKAYAKRVLRTRGFELAAINRAMITSESGAGTCFADSADFSLTAALVCQGCGEWDVRIYEGPGEDITAPAEAEPTKPAEIPVSLDLDDPERVVVLVPAEGIAWETTGTASDVAQWLGNATEADRQAIRLAAKQASADGRALRVSFPSVMTFILGYAAGRFRLCVPTAPAPRDDFAACSWCNHGIPCRVTCPHKCHDGTEGQDRESYAPGRPTPSDYWVISAHGGERYRVFGERSEDAVSFFRRALPVTAAHGFGMRRLFVDELTKPGMTIL